MKQLLIYLVAISLKFKIKVLNLWITEKGLYTYQQIPQYNYWDIPVHCQAVHLFFSQILLGLFDAKSSEKETK